MPLLTLQDAPRMSLLQPLPWTSPSLDVPLPGPQAQRAAPGSLPRVPDTSSSAGIGRCRLSSCFSTNLLGELG